jgi:DNA-binding response OmpR family regulator
VIPAPDAPTVLLVDDEACIRFSVSRVLQRAGFRVVTAATGLEALDRLRSEPVAAVVCDLRLPGLSGAALFEQIQATAPELCGRILIASGDLSEPDTGRLLERTGAPALLKPYGTSELLGALDRMCGVTDRAAALGAPRGGTRAAS